MELKVSKTTEKRVKVKIEDVLREVLGRLVQNGDMKARTMSDKKFTVELRGEEILISWQESNGA